MRREGFSALSPIFTRMSAVPVDGAPSPLEVLQAFHAGRVIRQHNLFSTATEEEQRATLHRVFDWWNYGAVPLLTRLEG